MSSRGFGFAKTALRSVAVALPALLCLAAADTWAAAGKPWITLTNCEYVVATYNDGDSFRVRSGTNGLIVRLYFVDAPERDLTYAERTREQSEHFGVTLDQTLKAGAEARDVVKGLLQKPFVVHTRWASAAGRSNLPRYYALVEVDGKSLAEILVSRGLARAKGVVATLPSGEKASAYLAKLKVLEAEAREKKAGIWAGSTAAKPPPKAE